MTNTSVILLHLFFFAEQEKGWQKHSTEVKELGPAIPTFNTEHGYKISECSHCVYFAVYSI